MSGKLLPYAQMIQDLEFYRDIGKKYKLERSGSSVALFVNGVKYFSSTVNKNRANTSLPNKEIYFIMKVKRYILKNDLVNSIPKNYKEPSEITYISFNNDIGAGEVLQKPYSIDITAAYWQTAYQQGWINEALFEEGKRLDKRIRLASLGSFAKRIYIYEFNGRRERLVDVIKPDYPHVFFNQAKVINGVMDACKDAVGDDFIFYWTDGVYVKNKKAAKICEDIINQYGYGYKTERLVSIIRHPNGFQTIEQNIKADGRIQRKKKLYKSDIV